MATVASINRLLGGVALFASENFKDWNFTNYLFEGNANFTGFMWEWLL